MEERILTIAAGAPELEFSGERIVPGKVPDALFREHEARYVFAGQFVAGKDVLDLACGTGIGTSYLLTAGARSCTGLDIAKGAIAYATAAYPSCTFAESDATSIRLPDNSIDVVVSFETIEHITDQRKFLLECRRVLRPGGLLVCSTPNRAISRWWAKNPFHVRELGVSEFRQVVQVFFADVRLYAQKPTFYLPHIAQILAVGLLDHVGLKEAVKKIVGWKPSPTGLRREFGETHPASEHGIRRYRWGLLKQPAYLIAVARKTHQ